MATVRAIDKLKQAFSVEERSSYSIFKGKELPKMDRNPFLKEKTSQNGSKNPFNIKYH